jgi:uncharacterized protein YgiM (DUF1202 family)
MTRLIILILLLSFTCSCAQAPVKPPEVSFYVTPEVTYLLESPGVGGQVLGPLYRGDEVEKLAVGESSWWRIKVLRSEQTGWIRKELLSSNPLPSVFYFVKEDTLFLRGCPRRDCLPLEILYRGDQVQRVEEGAQGWWRILVIKTRSLGWVPAASLTERIEAAQPRQAQKAYYYVAVRKLNLLARPSSRGEVIRALQFNDQVQKLGETDGWFIVRQPSSGALGWVVSRDLETMPLLSPRGVPAKDELKPFKQREEPELEPEFM